MFQSEFGSIRPIGEEVPLLLTTLHNEYLFFYWILNSLNTQDIIQVFLLIAFCVLCLRMPVAVPVCLKATLLSAWRFSVSQLLPFTQLYPKPYCMYIVSEWNVPCVRACLRAFREIRLHVVFILFASGYFRFQRLPACHDYWILSCSEEITCEKKTDIWRAEIFIIRVETIQFGYFWNRLVTAL